MNFNILPNFRVLLSGDGKMDFIGSEKSRLHKFLLSHKGEYQMKLERPKKRRSLNQNAYYHAVIIPLLAEELGEEDLQEMDDILESMFLPKKIKEVKGQQVAIANSCSKLSSYEFGEYVTRIIQWAGKEGIVVPLPDKNWDAIPVLLNEDG